MKIVPEQIARFLPGRSFTPLGTDGMGRSDTREALRRFFEIDAGHVVVAVLAAPRRAGRRQAGGRQRRDRPLRHRPRGRRPVHRVNDQWLSAGDGEPVRREAEGAAEGEVGHDDRAVAADQDDAVAPHAVGVRRRIALAVRIDQIGDAVTRLDVRRRRRCGSRGSSGCRPRCSPSRRRPGTTVRRSTGRGSPSTRWRRSRRSAVADQPRPSRRSPGSSWRTRTSGCPPRRPRRRASSSVTPRSPGTPIRRTPGTASVSQVLAPIDGYRFCDRANDRWATAKAHSACMPGAAAGGAPARRQLA